jgi:uncharacterized membrane protein
MINTMEQQEHNINSKRATSRSSKWALVSIAGIISLASILIITLFTLFVSSQMIIAGWVITALSVMGIAMAGAVIKASCEHE